MLVLMRKIGEEIRIGDNVTVTVLLTAGRRVKLGISGPGNVRILRGELQSERVASRRAPLASKGVASMIALETARHWSLEVERGPDCLLVKLGGRFHEDPHRIRLADQLWELLRQHFTYRLVVQLGDVDFLTSYVLRELITVAQRVCAQGGMMRLCSLSRRDAKVLRRRALQSELAGLRLARGRAVRSRPSRLPR